MINLIVQTDGASRGNPGPASYGVVIKDDKGATLFKEGKKIGETTNNVAEYTAVLKAFEWISNNFSDLMNLNIQVVADSKLVVEQLSGRYKIKQLHLKELTSLIKSLEKGFGQTSYKHTYRENNKEADLLANQALDNSI